MVTQTAFGKYIKTKGLSLEQAAMQLGSSRQHLHMLACGSATPSMKMAALIEKWSRGAVAMQSWIPYITGIRA